MKDVPAQPVVIEACYMKEDDKSSKSKKSSE